MRKAESTTGWCVLHVLVYAGAISASVCALLSYRSLITAASSDIENCMLYAKPKVHFNQKTSVCEIDVSTSEWGDETLCSFVFFTILASLVYGLIAVWFFMLCASSTRGEDGMVQGWKIVCPASALSTIIGLLVLIMAWEVSAGLNTFIQELEFKGQQNCTTKSSGITWDPGTTAGLFQKKNFLQASVWLMAISWAVATLLLCGRCCSGADFTTKVEYYRVKEDESTSTFLGSNEPVA